jgi:hypothetical protein
VTETQDLVPRQWKVIQHMRESCLDLSTVADWVGTAASPSNAPVEAMNAHGSRVARIHADDTLVLIVAKGKTRTGRAGTYARDNRPFARKRTRTSYVGLVLAE